MQANTNAAAVDADHANSAAAVSAQQEQAQGLTAEQFLHLFIHWTPYILLLFTVFMLCMCGVQAENQDSVIVNVGMDVDPE